VNIPTSETKNNYFQSLETSMKSNIILYLFVAIFLLVVLFGAAYAAMQLSAPQPTSAPRNMVQAPVIAKISEERAVVAPEPIVEAAPVVLPYVEDPAGEVVTIGVEMTQWTVCVDEAKVYSNPGANPDWYLYSLPKGTPVTVRELDATRTFAAVQVANYVLFTELCQ